MMRTHDTASNYLLTLSLRLILVITVALCGYLFIVKATADRLMSVPVVVADDDETDHYIYYAVYTAIGGQQSTLALNNPLHREQNVRVTLYNRQGEALVIPDISMAPNQNLYFNIADWIADSGRDGFSEGSLEIFFHGPPMGIGGQLVVTDERHSLSFDVPFMEDAMFASSQLESLWWSLEGQTTAKVFLANMKAERLTVTPTLYVNGEAHESEPIILESHASRVLNIRQALRKLNVSDGIVRGGITLKHDGQAGALAVAGAIINQRSGFSTTMRFIDIRAQHSTKLYGANLFIGKQDAEAGFAAGTSFVPRVTVRNTTARPVNVKTKVLYRTAGGARTVKLAPVVLAGNEVRELDLSRVITAIGTQKLIDAGIEIEHSGRAGSIVAALSSVDQSRSQVFDTPLRDPKSPSLDGGSYPFRIDGDNRAVIYLKNIDPLTDGKLRQCEVHLRFEGVEYTLPAQRVEAGQTLAIDIKKLRDEQVADGSGNVIPLDATKGQVTWYSWGALGKFIGRLAQYNPVLGTASSFSCPQPCKCNQDVNTSIPHSTYIKPDSIVGFPGESFQLSAWEKRGHCGTVADVEIMGVTFKSTNSTVVSINGDIATLGLTAGGAKVTAEWETSIYYGTTGGCPIDVRPQPASEPSSPDILPPECDPVECEYLPNPYGGKDDSVVTNIRIDITQDGTRITNTTHDVVVGQEINLGIQVAPATVTITGPQWSVPGNRIANYQAIFNPTNPNTTSGAVSLLTNLTSSAVRFYWVDGGDGRQVTISGTANVGTANGRSFTRTATFNVKRPTARIFATTFSQVEVGTLDDGSLNIHLGDRTGAPGLRFEKRVTLPVSGFNGDTQWVQLVTSSMRTRRTNGGVLETLQGSGLDSDYPYPPVPGAPLFAADSPHQPLYPTHTTQSIDDRFTMWLMFKPSGVAGTSIWVPLRKVNWSWSGNASRIADPNNPNNWVLNGTGTWSQNPPDADSTDHPQWMTNIKSYNYH